MMPIVYFHMFNFLHNPVYLEKNCNDEIFTIYDISLEMGWLGIVIMLLLDGKYRIIVCCYIIPIWWTAPFPPKENLYLQVSDP